LTPGLWRFRAWETPAMVPPVPAPHTKAWTRPPVWRHISSPAGGGGGGPAAPAWGASDWPTSCLGTRHAWVPAASPATEATACRCPPLPAAARHCPPLPAAACRCTCAQVRPQVGQVLELVREDCARLSLRPTACNVDWVVGVGDGHGGHPHHLCPCRRDRREGSPPLPLQRGRAAGWQGVPAFGEGGGLQSGERKAAAPNAREVVLCCPQSQRSTRCVMRR